MNNNPAEPTGDAAAQPEANRSEPAPNTPPPAAPEGQSTPGNNQPGGASARPPLQQNTKQNDDEVGSLRNNNRAEQVSGGTVSQAGRDVNNNGFSGKEVGDLFGKILRDIKDMFRDDSERSRSGRKATFKEVQIVVQQEPPKDAQEYAEQFDKLSDEDKLFVTLLRLLPDITWVNFWEIYDAAAEVVLPKPQEGKPKNGKKNQTSESTKPRFRSETYWAKVAFAAVTQTTEVYTEGRFSQTTVNFVSDQDCTIQVRTIIERSLSTYQRQWLFRLVPVLYALGKHPYVVIRRLAARAAAVLADIDWNEIQRMIIEPWSLDSDHATRISVACLFEAVVEAGTNDGQAIILLDRWSDPSENFYWRQSWTAAVALSFVGLQRFEVAKKDLQALARLADDVLNNYFNDKTKVPANYTDYLREVDKQLIEEVPTAVIFTLTNLSIEGKTHEILTMLKDWLALSSKQAIPFYWNAVIFRTLASISAETFDLKREKAEIKADFFVLLQNDKDLRKCLAEILVYFMCEGPEYRRVISPLLQGWTIQFADLDLNTEPVERVIVNMFRRLNSTNRERLLRSLKRWSEHKHAAVRTRGAKVLQLVLSANYPLPDKEGNPPDGSSGVRIVFGKP